MGSLECRSKELPSAGPYNRLLVSFRLSVKNNPTGQWGDNKAIKWCESEWKAQLVDWPWRHVAYILLQPLPLQQQLFNLDRSSSSLIWTFSLYLTPLQYRWHELGVSLERRQRKIHDSGLQYPWGEWCSSGTPNGRCGPQRSSGRLVRRPGVGGQGSWVRWSRGQPTHQADTMLCDNNKDYYSGYSYLFLTSPSPLPGSPVVLLSAPPYSPLLQIQVVLNR